ncbi:MAG TPA: pyridoxal phosphate-dependent aminotransferase [Polyangiaceae bacterium]
MYPRSKYLEWAIANGGKCRYDLATSGIATKPALDLVDTANAALHDFAGPEKLRAAIARANDVPVSNVIATLGTAHGVWLAYASLLSPGDEVVVEAPAYEPLLGAAQGIGAIVKRFERSPANAFAIDVDTVLRALGPKTKAILLSNLHNPSGARTPNEVLAAIAKGAAKNGTTLIVDEVYAPFDSLVDGEGIWRESARKLGDNVVTMSSLTKCYGLGPHRVGWILGSPAMIAQAETVMLTTCGSLPLAHAGLALRAFEALPALADRARAGLAKRRSTVAEWIAARSDVEWSAPATGLFGFVHVKKLNVNVRAVVEAAMKDDDVIVVPGEFFEMPNGFRLAWSLDEALLPEALVRLGRLLDRM